MAGQPMRAHFYERTFTSARALVTGLTDVDDRVRAVGGGIDHDKVFCGSVLQSLRQLADGSWLPTWSHHLLVTYWLPVGTDDPLASERKHQA